MPPSEKLREEVDYLGRRFGDALRAHEGDDGFELVEAVRSDARAFCDGDEGAGDRLAERLANLPNNLLKVVVKAFSGFLELANLAEDRQRVRAIRDAAHSRPSQPRKESIRDALATLREQGFSAMEVQKALDRLDIDLVFTAHPTEAKRKSLRQKLRNLRGLLTERDDPQLLPRERQRVEGRVEREMSKLWQTDAARPMRPTVLEEVERGLSFLPVLWDTAPKILDELREAIAASYPDGDLRCARPLRFGSWMGGDRDGHPHVTPDITRQTVEWLRHAALDAHLDSCRRLLDSLSMACHEGRGCGDLLSLVQQARELWPVLDQEIEGLAPSEGYRLWLRIVMWRLEQSRRSTLGKPSPEGAYGSAAELQADLEHVRKALVESDNADLADTELQEWLDQIGVFGMQFARLDIRQHSGVYASVMRELWVASGVLGAEEELDEARRIELLRQTMPLAKNLSPVDLSDSARETLELFRTLRRLARRYGMESLGAHIVSMTHEPSDVLTVLWLWRWSERTGGGDPRDAELRLPLAPLLETIEDLNDGPRILKGLLELPEYREHVAALGDQQMVMVGYSDSTKDGGYLAACWALQRGQINIHAAGAQAGVHVTFFHGRGGSLGRGGGPAARAILSLPGVTFDGSLRLTEQGEVLAERYDSHPIAHRHLEQVFWSVLMAATHDYSKDDTQEWRTAMDRMSDSALEAYRLLVEKPGFVPFFRTATPIAGIEQLPIGSRPAKRKGGDSIQDLRAIPWVFSWTQSRCLLPAWYGLGSAVLAELDADPKRIDTLREMYARWRFFQATIDNTTLALAKANMPVFRRYVAQALDTVDDPAALEAVAGAIYVEFDRTREAILRITRNDELLDDIPWLQRSIRVRNRYVDPLNFVQLELMRRSGEAEPETPEAEQLARLVQLAIKGVAAGMRTTG
ncbi:Phosphoenolpyruvate carboxylase [Pseudobythopirellula maris]|uniref:Phosphoenolpyruvate carboxylase n=1 Tax=Pseudobythopirellula maris TaxID=2527991 RepID=A0A5C5ZKI3_9BACT|nr:phosphoenolpyruvate carboxylase [Pseudobythopirellula maris]TWT87655.1 Phosphoenolpyruvate carboxylase [Pseudobythopirellula maris]